MPLSATRKTHSGWVRALVKSFESKGFNAPALFAQAGLSEADIIVKDTVSQDQITLLWDCASEFTANPLFGLHTGASLPVNALGSVSYALMSCETLGDSLALLVQYQHIIADALNLSINQHTAMTELVFNNIGDLRPPSYHAIDASMSAFLAFYGWILREPLTLVAVNFIRADASLLTEYQAFFDCKVRFRQNNNSLWLHNEILAKPLATADKDMAKLHQQALIIRAREKMYGDFRRMVADLIRQNISQENFGLGLVASRLFMSKSSLQRKLKDEQINFQQLLDETREYMAIARLRQTSLSIAQIAEQLGFANASGFTRTFKRWTGKTPKAYRL